MYQKGISLTELLFALGVTGVLICLSTSMLERAETYKLEALSHELAASIRFARSQAVHAGTHVTVQAQEEDWSMGWVIYIDANDNGSLDEDEPVLMRKLLDGHIRLIGNSPVKHYVRYNPSGQAVLLNGAFQAGTLTLCPSTERAQGIKAVLNSAGRLRLEVQEDGSVCARSP